MTERVLNLVLQKVKDTLPITGVLTPRKFSYLVFFFYKEGGRKRKKRRSGNGRLIWARRRSPCHLAGQRGAECLHSQVYAEYLRSTTRAGHSFTVHTSLYRRTVLMGNMDRAVRHRIKPFAQGHRAR